VPPALTAHALAEALGVSPDWLAFNLKVQGRARADSARLWQAVRALQEQRASR
jgi:hypothetical protein